VAAVKEEDVMMINPDDPFISQWMGEIDDIMEGMIEDGLPGFENSIKIEEPKP